MKTKHLLFNAAIFFVVQSIAQTPVTNSTVYASGAAVPSTYNWDTASVLPDGWSVYGTGIYTTGNLAPNSGKFDTQNDSLVIHISSKATAVRCFLKGNSLKAPYEFTVLESNDGISYAILQQFSDASSMLGSKFAEYVFTPDAESRYFRFEYTKRTGGNIAIDDVVISGDETTSIHEDKNEIDYYLYSNPADNIIYIQSFMHDIEVHLYDLLGAEVKACTIQANNAREINTSNLQKGIYLVSVRNNNTIIKTTRFVKR